MGYILRSNTKDEIDSYAKEIMGDCITQSTKDMVQHLAQKGESVTRSFRQVFDRLFLLCHEMQQKKEKGSIAFIHIFYLKSALVTGRYELQINLFDRNSYLDPYESYGIWYPEFFIKHFEADLENFKESASKNLIRFEYQQFQDISMRYYDMYLALIGQFIMKEAHGISELPSFKKMEKESGIVTLYGGYMDKGLQVYPPLEVNFCDTIG